MPMVTLQDPIAEDAIYLYHRVWKNLADAQLGALPLWTSVHDARRC